MGDNPPLQIVATIRELMDSVVDPAADALWDSVSTTYTEKGVDDHQPRTDEDWQAVRRHAMALSESMNLLIMDRHAAPAGTRPGLGELTPGEIEKLIASTRPAFVDLARGLQETALQALAAADRKDPQALLKIGAQIDAACEACHVTYWYPNQFASE